MFISILNAIRLIIWEREKLGLLAIIIHLLSYYDTRSFTYISNVSVITPRRRKAVSVNKRSKWLWSPYFFQFKLIIGHSRTPELALNRINYGVAFFNVIFSFIMLNFLELFGLQVITLMRVNLMTREILHLHLRHQNLKMNYPR